MGRQVHTSSLAWAVDLVAELQQVLAGDRLEGLAVGGRHLGPPAPDPFRRRRLRDQLVLARSLLGGDRPPADRPQLVKQAYAWGARNCELHFCQVRGDFQPFRGISMPTFLPETG